MAATFEENMEALEQIVQSLEEGTATLDESLK
ncbi:MAG: exodeoxyribonuclease VII small subunit, partial [Deltaproteobacteria bacterium]|nr:exodeoxyribonuclease VII small subunit [Deltaproteobacteria bacterium]